MPRKCWPNIVPNLSFSQQTQGTPEERKEQEKYQDKWDSHERSETDDVLPGHGKIWSWSEPTLALKTHSRLLLRLLSGWHGRRKPWRFRFLLLSPITSSGGSFKQSFGAPRLYHYPLDWFINRQARTRILQPVYDRQLNVWRLATKTNFKEDREEPIQADVRLDVAREDTKRRTEARVKKYS